MWRHTAGLTQLTSDDTDGGFVPWWHAGARLHCCCVFCLIVFFSWGKDIHLGHFRGAGISSRTCCRDFISEIQKEREKVPAVC